VSLEEFAGDLMDKCSCGTTSHEPFLLTDRRGHDLGIGFETRTDTVLTRRRLREQSPLKGAAQSPIRLAR
jgi:hypothetical protein